MGAGDNPQTESAVPEVTVLVGKDPRRVDLVCQLPTVSSVHCEIGGGASGWWIRDLNSTNGTFVRGERARAGEKVAIRYGEQFSLGRSGVFTFAAAMTAKLRDPDAFRQLVIAPDSVVEAAPAPPLAAPPARRVTQAIVGLSEIGIAQVVADDDDSAHVGEITNVTRLDHRTEPSGAVEAPVPGPDAVYLSIGYTDANDIALPNQVVSARHARVYLDGERFILEDLGSMNGTWLGEARVQRVHLREGETFRLGTYSLEFGAKMVERLRQRQKKSHDRTVGIALTAVAVTLKVGRLADNDVVIPAPVVSGHHATLTWNPARDGFMVTDLGSTNGTYVHNRDNRIVAPTFVGGGDVIYFGSYRYPVSRALTLVQDVQRGQPMGDAKRRFVIGRDEKQVDIAIDKPAISRIHAEVSVLSDGRFEVRDLDSANGVFVNGERIKGRAVVTADDRVSLGGLPVHLDPDKGVVRDEYRGDIVLQAQRITVEVPDPKAPGGQRRILNDISFTAYPTEFIGLMGPSGAGKTTLMLALNGYTPPTAGRSLINGQDLYQHYNSFRGNIGYVPQDDIVFPQLTVYESLYYTARLRLPGDTTHEEIDRKITDILTKLEIIQTRDVLIGDALKKGISGGQRKRVNLAQELITEPSLLFLDEPTSGLASEDTINVMRLLRALADDGKTILLTIHQPSTEAYRLMDNIIYLFEGNLVYYGPAYPTSILYFNPTVDAGPNRDKILADPGNALKPLAADQRQALAGASSPAERSERLKQVVNRRVDEYRESPFYHEFVADRDGTVEQAVDITTRNVERTQRHGLLRQWRILTTRAARIKQKDTLNTFILLAQAPIIATVLALVFAVGGAGTYFDGLIRGPSALFLLVASAVWFGCSNSAREIVSELPIYRRERMVNLMIPAYVMSKASVLGVLCALQCLMLLAIVYVPLQLEGGFLPMYLILVLTSWVGMGMGLTLSALVASAEASMALVPLLLIPQIILGGVIMPVHEMSMPMKVLSSTMAARWGYEALLHVEYGDDTLDVVRQRCEIPSCVWAIAQDGYQYYSGDPEDAQAAESRSGIEALGEAPPVPVMPVEEGLCQAFCLSLRDGSEVTPLDRSFGVDSDDPMRARAYSDIVVEAGAADSWTLALPHVRAGLQACLGVLAAGVLALMLLVMSLLKFRDVEVG
jgi:ABC-type multidrug transport system ATPase subunit/pSer/pThr/pTyr-binding forkhead associated (FHA) protein